ncbi:FtsX-like permease family protein [Cellulomonas palmilytica]|uniref:FtsX-like permease family protein n=1 Tax=Cellulomonas palmilytica TaxID=2608402 RepID=UPI001F20E15F|nr:FtsX-like permease family protein [Cellulomonas palmilytica]UJP41184.1 hypothetical protein F1D97_07010 [Cellulomonas palmilytica]
MNATTRIRTVGAAGPLLVRRRARTDAGLLALTGALLAALVLVALLAPRLVTSVADAGARDAVERSRPDTDVVARVTGATPPLAGVRPDDAAEALHRDAATVDAGIPAGLRADLAGPSLSTTTSAWTATVPAGTAVARAGYVIASDGQDAVRWVSGRAPELLADVQPAEEQPLSTLERRVEVGVTADALDALGLALGDEVRVTGAMVTRLTAVVVGTYEVVDPQDPVWTALPEFVTATPAPASTGSVAAAGLLVTDASVPDLLVAMQPTAVTTDVRFVALPDRLTAARARTLAAQVVDLRADPGPLQLRDARTPTLATSLDDVLLEYRARLAGATAQASVLLLGIVSVGALTILLAARLLVERRSATLTLERARGASVASVGWRSLLESVPLAASASAVAVGLLVLLLPRVGGSWWPGAAVAAVGVLAPAVLAAALVRRSWTGRRVPANRADRDRLASRRRTRRLVAELTLLAVAAGALLSVRSRGLLSSSAGDVDWLLAATPVLLAGAATVLAAHVVPPVLRRLRAVASRGPALAGLVATARAERASRTAIPLLSVTVAVALVVFSGITVTTVDRGQDRAADLLVGGDVRIDGPVDDAVLDALRTQDGVTSVVGSRTWVSRTFGVGSGVDVTLLAVDAEHWARLRAAQGAVVDDGLAGLGADAPGGVPALVSPELQRIAEAFDPQVWTTDVFVPVDVRGTTSVRVDGAPTVVVDRTALAAGLGAPVPAQTTWVLGRGADEAVVAEAVAALPEVSVLSRVEWLDTWNSSPLTTGLRTLLRVAQAALAVLAVVALVLTVVATARDRRRTLHVLRTLGLDAGTARRLSAGEVAPIAVAGLLAGSAIGVVVPWLLTNALGLSALTGEPGTTRVTVTWLPFAVAVGALAAGLAVAVEVEARTRRDDDLALGIREAER